MDKVTKLLYESDEHQSLQIFLRKRQSKSKLLYNPEEAPFVVEFMSS